jgi:CHAT domain-containing protein
MMRSRYPKDEYPEGHSNIAAALDELGSLLHNQGEHAKAEVYFRDSLAMLRRLYPKEKYPDGNHHLSTTLNNLGLLFRDQREYAKAKLFLSEAVTMDRRLYRSDHPELATSIDNLGLVLTAQDEYDKAEALHGEAVEMYRRLYPLKRFPDGHPDLAGGLDNLAAVFQMRGEYSKAETFHLEALKMNRRLYPEEKYPDGHPNLASSMDSLGSLFQAQREYAKAAPYCRGALEIHQRLASRYADLFSEAEALNYIASFPQSRNLFLSITRHLPPDPADYNRVWASRAALTRVLERRHRDLVASHDSDTRDLGRQLGEARQRLAYALLHPAPDPKAHLREVQERTDAKEDLERRLARQLTLAPIRNDRKQGTPGQLSERLPLGATFVDLLRYTDFEWDPKMPGRKGEKGTDRYVAVVLCKDKNPVRVELKEAAPIDDASAAWLRAITATRSDEKAERDAAATFRDLVWKPIRDALPAELKTVYLAPDGKLCQVPWGALPGTKADTVLLDECAVCLVPHGPFLLERLEEKHAGQAGDILLAYGGVDYDKAAESEVKGENLRAPLGKKRVVWKGLPGTAREQEQVVALAKKVLRDTPIARSGRAASTAQLEEDLPKARYAHIATHGFFADPEFRSAIQVDSKLFDYRGFGERRGGARSPSVLSGLVLAGANREGEKAVPDRGIITGEGLLGLRLEGLELAVLSACETGLGEEGGGEGVYGLQRAFHIAGCKDVVASLWKVDDSATQAMMALFYRNLWEKKLDAAEALRQAQLTLYRNPAAVAIAKNRGVDFTERDLPDLKSEPEEKAKRSPTAHWAAFTFSGVRPLPKKK